MDSLSRFRMITEIERGQARQFSACRGSIPGWLSYRQTLWTYQMGGTHGWFLKRFKYLGRRLRTLGRLMQARAIDRVSPRASDSYRSPETRVAFVGRRAHKMSAGTETGTTSFDRTLECIKQGAASMLGEESILTLEFESISENASLRRPLWWRHFIGALRDYRDINTSLRRVLNDVDMEVGSSLRRHADFQHLRSLCALNTASMLLSRAHWKRLLAHEVNVSHIFIAAWYFPDAMGLIAAAHEMNCTVVDVQHGQQGAIHGMYCGWNALDAYSDALPDFFWVWNNYTADNIVNSSDPAIAHRVIVGGRCLPPKTAATRSRHAKGVGETSGPNRTVVIALQPENRDSGMPIPDQVLDYIRRLGPSRIIVKPHPVMHAGLLDEAVNALSQLPSTLEVRAPREPLGVSMSEATLHLTSHSSSVFDAIHAGVPTVLWGLLASEQFRGVVDAGLAWLLNDAPVDWDSINSEWKPKSIAYFEPSDLCAARDKALSRILLNHPRSDANP